MRLREFLNESDNNMCTSAITQDGYQSNAS